MTRPHVVLDLDGTLTIDDKRLPYPEREPDLAIRAARFAVPHERFAPDKAFLVPDTARRAGFALVHPALAASAQGDPMALHDAVNVRGWDGERIP